MSDKIEYSRGSPAVIVHDARGSRGVAAEVQVLVRRRRAAGPRRRRRRRRGAAAPGPQKAPQAAAPPGGGHAPALHVRLQGDHFALQQGGQDHPGPWTVIRAHRFVGDRDGDGAR